MKSLLLIVPMASLLGCGAGAPPPPAPAETQSAPAPVAVAAPPPSATPAPSPAPTPASPAPVATAPACAALHWDANHQNADAATFEGTLSMGEAGDQNGKMEKMFLLALTSPACGPDGTPVAEVQVFTGAKSVDLKKWVGKGVTVSGASSSEQTGHHHRPIVVDAKTVAAK